jgi:hypothetical protein
LELELELELDELAEDGVVVGDDRVFESSLFESSLFESLLVVDGVVAVCVTDVVADDLCVVLCAASAAYTPIAPVAAIAPAASQRLVCEISFSPRLRVCWVS